VFDVLHNDGTTTITVAEGFIAVQSSEPSVAGQTYSLKAGDQLFHADGSRAFSATRIDPATVLAWRQGYLIYRATPLSKVIGDLNRYFAQPIVLADAEVGAQKFSGVLKVDDEEAVLGRLSKFLPITADRDDGHRIILRMSKTGR
jgi:transmembrane sensor